MFHKALPVKFGNWESKWGVYPPSSSSERGICSPNSGRLISQGGKQRRNTDLGEASTFSKGALNSSTCGSRLHRLAASLPGSPQQGSCSLGWRPLSLHFPCASILLALSWDTERKALAFRACASSAWHMAHSSGSPACHHTCCGPRATRSASPELGLGSLVASVATLPPPPPFKPYSSLSAVAEKQRRGRALFSRSAEPVWRSEKSPKSGFLAGATTYQPCVPSKPFSFHLCNENGTPPSLGTL